MNTNTIILQLILSISLGLLISGGAGYLLLTAIYKVGNRWLGWK